MHKMENKTDAVTKTISIRWKPTVWNNAFLRLTDGCPGIQEWYRTVQLMCLLYNTSTWGPRHQSPCIPCIPFTPALFSIMQWCTCFVQGFVSLADVSSPPVYSRHLVLPVSQGRVSNMQCCGSGSAFIFSKAVGETRNRWIEAWIEGEASASTRLFLWFMFEPRNRRELSNFAQTRHRSRRVVFEKRTRNARFRGIYTPQDPHWFWNQCGSTLVIGNKVFLAHTSLPDTYVTRFVAYFCTSISNFRGTCILSPLPPVVEAETTTTFGGSSQPTLMSHMVSHVMYSMWPAALNKPLQFYTCFHTLRRSMQHPLNCGHLVHPKSNWKK